MTGNRLAGRRWSPRAVRVVSAAAVVAGSALIVAACGERSEGATPSGDVQRQACVPTVANGRTPPGEAPQPRYHGNDALWVILPPQGVIRPHPSWVKANGSIHVKFPWWRATEGMLTITGRRLDARARPLTARIPPSYGTIGFQATTIVFPTRGCWSVTGRVASARLTFVVKVLRK
jgi:hypothetical protein